ncbi:MAG: RHS repeat-associated core domain-containing protein, partial [Gemmatimonadales bacterium]
MLKDYGVSFWGQAAPDTGVTTRIRLGGREYDRETGLYYLRGRYYDPGLGRFLSEDPLGVAG